MVHHKSILIEATMSQEIKCELYQPFLWTSFLLRVFSNEHLASLFSRYSFHCKILLLQEVLRERLPSLQ